MALVGQFAEGVARTSMHPTKVTMIHRRVETPGGVRLVQIDTGGSADREHPGKPSQTLQFDREAASRLVGVLREAFPGI